VTCIDLGLGLRPVLLFNISGCFLLSTSFPVLFFLLSAAAVTLFAVFRIGRRNQLINTADHNKKAIYLYREIEKMLSFGHALPGKRASLEDCEEYVQEHPEVLDQIQGGQV
jgi:hypothetical protein